MSDAESVAARPTHQRPDVVKIVEACEKLLDENGRTYVRAAHLDVEDATSYQIGTILALLADSAETVAELYEIEKAAQLEVSRWGRSGGTTRWEISWIES